MASAASRRLASSTNGRFVAFYSDADNLVPNDTNGCRDVFVRDLIAGVNFLVSVNTNGNASGDGISTDPAISGDGRYVAFTSSADNLVVVDTNRSQDVFVRDMLAGTTTLVSVSTDGINSGNGDSFSPSISAERPLCPVPQQGVQSGRRFHLAAASRIYFAGTCRREPPTR